MKQQLTTRTHEIREAITKYAIEIGVLLRAMEEIYLDLEEEETEAFEGKKLGKLKEFQSRCTGLQQEIARSHDGVLKLLNRVTREANYNIEAIQHFQERLRAKGISDQDQRRAGTGLQLHPDALRQRAKRKDRRTKRDELQRFRERQISRATETPSGDAREEEAEADQN